MQLALESSAPVSSRRKLAAEVKQSLSRTPRQLSCKYLYDALGSQLFEAICELPWYRITRAETYLLYRYAAAIVDALPAPVSLVELGCGSGDKIAVLGEALRTRDAVPVHLIDISATALDLSSRTLARLPHLVVTSHQAAYETGLARAAASRPAEGSWMVLFLGSNIGNLDMRSAEEFLQRIRSSLRKGDALLLGADLVKPAPDLIAAYDDPVGVTAAFNKNLLLRLNRELGADFDLRGFDHLALWNERESRVEMHLASKRRQRVRIPMADLELEFALGETIWTESSYKYTSASIQHLAERAGFQCRQEWIEPGAQFALDLFVAV